MFEELVVLEGIFAVITEACLFSLVNKTQLRSFSLSASDFVCPDFHASLLFVWFFCCKTETHSIDWTNKHR